MPAMQVMTTRLNTLFQPPQLEDLDPRRFAPGSNLLEAAASYGVAQTDPERQFLASWPKGQLEMLRALIFHNLSHNKPRLAMTWAWAPGYDFGLNVFEAPGTPVSPGGITLVLQSRYPLDAHPSQARG